jgi:hypothetical protein
MTGLGHSQLSKPVRPTYRCPLDRVCRDKGGEPRRAQSFHGFLPARTPSVLTSAPPAISTIFAFHLKSYNMRLISTRLMSASASWQELSDVLRHWSGAVTCPGLSTWQVWPLAQMLCADRAPNRSHALASALTQTGSPDPRNDPICITSSCPRQFVETRGLSCCWQQSWFPERLRADHHGPGHARVLGRWPSPPDFRCGSKRTWGRAIGEVRLSPSPQERTGSDCCAMSEKCL